MRERLKRVLAPGHHLQWVLADQAVVSGCNLAIAVLYARMLGPSGFGVYALIFMAQQYFVSISTNLVGNPLITAAPHAPDAGEERRMIEGGFAAQLAVSAALGVVSAAVTAIFLHLGAPGLSGLAVASLAASSFGLPLLEWCRRLCFLHRKGPLLLQLDTLVYAPVLSGAVIAAWHDRLTLDVALALWAGASLVACLWGVLRLRMPLRVAGAYAFVVRHGRAAKDFVFSFQAQWLGSQGIVYLVLPWMGTAGVGAYRSIASLTGFANPIGTTLDNTLPFRFAEIYRKGGSPALRRHAVRVGSVVIGLSVLVLIPIVVFSERIVDLVLGDEYVPYSNILYVQSLAVAVAFATRIALAHERARQRTRPIARSALAGAAVSIVAALGVTSDFGPLGLAWSVTLGATVALVYLVCCMSRDVKPA
jgi:O-antigen/teichoic acid export membrane protein